MVVTVCSSGSTDGRDPTSPPGSLRGIIVLDRRGRQSNAPAPALGCYFTAWRRMAPSKPRGCSSTPQSTVTDQESSPWPKPSSSRPRDRRSAVPSKGSLATMRPDDLATQIVRAALDKVPELDPGSIDDLMMGCAMPGGESGFNIGADRRGANSATTSFPVPR